MKQGPWEQEELDQAVDLFDELGANFIEIGRRMKRDWRDVYSRLLRAGVVFVNDDETPPQQIAPIPEGMYGLKTRNLVMKPTAPPKRIEKHGHG